MRSARELQSDGRLTELHFIPVDGLQSREHRNGKPESQKYLTAARKHVMCGSKRRARKLRSISTHDGHSPRLQATNSVAKFATNLHPGHDYGVVCQLEIPTFDGSRLDPFVRWPVAITYRMRYLLDNILFTDCESLRPFRSVTWPLLNLDPGIFYHSLAVSAFCLSARDLPCKKEALISEGLFYYNKGLNSVQNRLGDTLQRRTDGIIASIMGIAIHTFTGSAKHGWCWERALSSPRCEDATDQWILHFQALRTILNDRGGVESLLSNRRLRHWLYIMDTEGTLTRDMQPFFELPPYLPPSMQALSSPQKPDVVTCVSSWTQEFPALQAIIHIFVDLDYIIPWLSRQLVPQHGISCAHLDMDASLLLPLLHRCLQLSKRNSSEFSSDNCDMAFQDALRHAIILFLAPIRRCLGPPALGTDLHIMKLISALHLCVVHRTTLKMQKLIFWMLVVGAMEACRLGMDASWLFSRIVDCCAMVGAKQFEHVREVVKYFMAQLIWLEEAVSSAFELMMENLRSFMEMLNTLNDENEANSAPSLIMVMPRSTPDYAETV